MVLVVAQMSDTSYEQVRRFARSPGYVEVGVTGRIWRRNPDRPGEVELTSAWENGAVYELLDLGELVRDHTEHVEYNSTGGQRRRVRALTIRLAGGRSR